MSRTLNGSWLDTSLKMSYTQQETSNENRAPSCLGDLLGMTCPTQLYGDYFINHKIMIPSLNNQYTQGLKSHPVK